MHVDSPKHGNPETRDYLLGSPYLLNDMPYADTIINAYSAANSVPETLESALFVEAPIVGRCPVDSGGDWLVPITVQPTAATA